MNIAELKLKIDEQAFADFNYDTWANDEYPHFEVCLSCYFEYGLRVFLFSHRDEITAKAILSVGVGELVVTEAFMEPTNDVYEIIEWVQESLKIAEIEGVTAQ